MTVENGGKGGKEICQFETCTDDGCEGRLALAEMNPATAELVYEMNEL